MSVFCLVSVPRGPWACREPRHDEWHMDAVSQVHAPSLLLITVTPATAVRMTDLGATWPGSECQLGKASLCDLRQVVDLLCLSCLTEKVGVITAERTE